MLLKLNLYVPAQSTPADPDYDAMPYHGEFSDIVRSRDTKFKQQLGEEILLSLGLHEIPETSAASSISRRGQPEPHPVMDREREEGTFKLCGHWLGRNCLCPPASKESVQYETAQAYIQYKLILDSQKKQFSSVKALIRGHQGVDPLEVPLVDLPVPQDPVLAEQLRLHQRQREEYHRQTEARSVECPAPGCLVRAFNRRQFYSHVLAHIRPYDAGEPPKDDKFGLLEASSRFGVSKRLISPVRDYLLVTDVERRSTEESCHRRLMEWGFLPWVPPLSIIRQDNRHMELLWRRTEELQKEREEAAGAHQAQVQSPQGPLQPVKVLSRKRCKIQGPSHGR